MKSSMRITSLCLIGCLSVTTGLAEERKSMGGMSGQKTKSMPVDPLGKEGAPAATPINIPKEAKKSPIIKKPNPAATPINIPGAPAATPITIPKPMKKK